MNFSVTKYKSITIKKARNFFENFVKNFYDKFFWRQHPETALRYLPVVNILNKLKFQDAKILEIGSGSLGITPYLKREIDGLDVDFTGPQTQLVNKIKGTADKIPFRKNSYDVVVSVDVLEHLQKETREKAITELLRVAKKLVIIVTPIGELSEKQDHELFAYWKKIFKEPNKFLEEHIKNGLPRVDEILVQIDKSSQRLKKSAKITSSPLLNLLVRNILMRTWISKNKLMYYLYMKGYLLFLPALIFANFGNCYRRIFVIKLANQ